MKQEAKRELISASKKATWVVAIYILYKLLGILITAKSREDMQDNATTLLIAAPMIYIIAFFAIFIWRKVKSK